MSSTGESAMKSSSKGKSRASKPISPSDRAGLQFPVARIKRCLKKEKYADIIDKMAPVYLAGVLEYLAIEVLNLAGEVAKGEKKKIIKPRHISLAVQNDTELNKLLENVTIPFSGRGLQIESNLLPKNNAES